MLLLTHFCRSQAGTAGGLLYIGKLDGYHRTKISRDTVAGGDCCARSG